jgi:hypothetical protein
MNIKTILTTLGVCIGAAAHAETRQKLTMEHATVFLRGAEVSCTAKVTLAKGENEFIFSNVATNINTGSVQISATNGVAVQSVNFQNYYQPKPEVIAPVTIYNDSIKRLGRKRIFVANKIEVLDDQIAAIKTSLSTDNTLPASELSKRLEMAGTKLQACLDSKSKQEEILQGIDEQITQLQQLQQQQTEERREKPVPGGQLQVKLYASASTTSTVTITYIMPDAGWSPIYDIMADDIKSPMQIYYKANIYQRGGVSWDNVKLTLSTGNPQEGMQIPVVNPVYVSLYTPPPVTATTTTTTTREMVTAYKKPLVNPYKTNTVLTAEEIKNKPSGSTVDLVALTPGIYQNQRGAAINSDGGRTSGNLYAIDGVQAQASVASYVNVNNDGMNTTFDIDLPYTIPCDGQQHLVAVNKYKANATYEYYVAPKFDRDAFLIAKVTDWQELNLLPGQTNIFYEGTFIGQGNINPQQLGDTMRISLGRDKKIIVKRERNKELRSTKTIGSNVKEQMAYTTTIRNTRKEAINIILEDQVPVSNNSTVEIQDIEVGNAERNESTGSLRWSLSVPSNETKVNTFAYTVKYPKSGIIQQ